MPCDGQHVADGVGEDLGHDGSGEVLGVAGVGRDGTKGLSEFRKLKPTAVLKDVEVGEGIARNFEGGQGEGPRSGSPVADHAVAVGVGEDHFVAAFGGQDHLHFIGLVGVVSACGCPGDFIAGIVQDGPARLVAPRVGVEVHNASEEGLWQIGRLDREGVVGGVFVVGVQDQVEGVQAGGVVRPQNHAGGLVTRQRAAPRLRQDHAAVHHHGQVDLEEPGGAEVSDLGHNGFVAPCAAVQFSQVTVHCHVIRDGGDQAELVIGGHVFVRVGVGGGALHEVHHVVDDKRRRGPTGPSRVGRPLRPSVGLRVVRPKLTVLHRTVGFSVAAQRKAQAVVRKLRARHASLARQFRHVAPGLRAGVVGVPRVEDVFSAVPKPRVDDAVDPKLVGVVPGRGGEVGFLAPGIGGHVVVPPIAEVA